MQASWRAPSWGTLCGQGSTSSGESSEPRAEEGSCCPPQTQTRPDCPAGSGSHPPRLCSRPGHPEDCERLSLSWGGALRGPPTPGERTSLTRAVHGSQRPEQVPGAYHENAQPLPALHDHPRDRWTPPSSPVTRSCFVVPAGPGGWQRASAAPGVHRAVLQFKTFHLRTPLPGSRPVDALVGPCPLVTQAFPLLSAPLVVAMGRGCSRSYAG